MGRAKRCAICTSDAAISAAVNAQIESGICQKMIHAEFPQFSVSQVSRHTRGCLAPKPTGDLSTEQGSQEIARWLERAEQTFLVAQANGDTKSAASAISTAVRTLQSLHKRRETEQKAVKDGVDRDSYEFTIKGCDAMLAEYAKQPESSRAVDARCIQLLGDQQFRHLVSQIWERRELLPALITATANYIPERKTENVQPSN